MFYHYILVGKLTPKIFIPFSIVKATNLIIKSVFLFLIFSLIINLYFASSLPLLQYEWNKVASSYK